MSYTKAAEPKIMTVHLGALSATTTKFCFKAPFEGELIAAEVCDTTSYTGHASNNYTFAVNKGTIASATAMATLTTTADLAAGVPTALTVSTTAATRRFTAIDDDDTDPDIIHVVATKNNSAANTTNVSLAFKYVPLYNWGSES